MQEGKDAVQTVFAEQPVHLCHARLGADVIGQGVQGTKRFACLDKGGWSVCNYNELKRTKKNQMKSWKSAVNLLTLR